MKKKKALVTIAACATALTIMVGGTMAYLTDTETTTNTFTVGKVTIDLLEPNYPGNGSDETTDVVPGEEIKKDPQIKNTGKNSSIVFMRVNIPMKNVITAAEDGKRLNDGKAVNTELFLFKNDEGGGYNSVNSNWVELSKTYLNANGDVVDANSATMCSYLYGYKHVLGVDETTKPVFSVVKLANLIENQDDNGTENINIYSYAIQSDNISGITTSKDGTTNYNFASDMEKLSDADKKTTLNNIYQVYVNQTDAVDGTGTYDIKANVKGTEKIKDADSTPNQTLKNSTLNITMSVANRHLKLNTGNADDTTTNATMKVSYVGTGSAMGDKDVVFYVKDGDNKAQSNDIIAVEKKEENGKYVFNIIAKSAGKAVVYAEVTNPDNGKVSTATVTITVTDQNKETVKSSAASTAASTESSTN